MGKNIQKELINGIFKCFKHQAKLATTIQYIVNIIRNTGLRVFSLDLANAYANVHHQLIHFTSSFDRASHSMSSLFPSLLN